MKIDGKYFDGIKYYDVVFASSFTGEHVDYTNPYTGDFIEEDGEIVSPDYRDRAYTKYSDADGLYIPANWYEEDTCQLYTIVTTIYDNNYNVLCIVIYPI